jgi:hypothetical protein
MSEISILRIRFNYYDLQTATLLFLQLNVFLPALIILTALIIQNFTIFN